MAMTNVERVGKALALLNTGLFPFFKRELINHYGDEWFERATANLRDYQMPNRGKGEADNQWDTQAILTVMWDQWNLVFKETLGHAERTLVSELREVRNNWAHQKPFNGDDTYRALDSVQRLLAAVSAGEQADEVGRMRDELLRVRFDEQQRNITRRVAATPVEGQPTDRLLPWREIVSPHPDVAAGRYQQAEFMADLAQVARGEGSEEYRQPRAFFQRTFITDGLKRLLVNALRRLGENDGDPVVELQTNFGGGKTHSLLALYHLASGAPIGDLVGMEPLLDEAGVTAAPVARRAVLSGIEISPGQPRHKPDGVVTRTFWGEMAWQLLGREGYALVAEADQVGVSPGAEALRQVLTTASPCLILIDEWVTYLRQLYHKGDGLPAGSFDANLTFAQALTEAVKASPRALLVVSIPESDIEKGGEGGQEATTRLRNVFGRIESAWRPASAEEGFEIVRRRLFEPITDPRLFAARDAVAKTYADFYSANKQDFPARAYAGDYIQRIKNAYPIHPELFDRLYNDWSQLDRFQRTRGVLRLMSKVISVLWQRNDRSLLIMPAMIPIDDSDVQSELTRYLEDHWVPILEKDVDGAQSLPMQIDKEHNTLGRYSATRRVARTIYLGSAPTFRAANRGIEEQFIRLGCVQPGEIIQVFGDALRRLSEQATHLYAQDRRYWYSTQPNVTRTALDRAESYDQEVVIEEIERLLRQKQGQQSQRGEFAHVHVCPGSGGDVVDEREARLVILRPQQTHIAKDQESAALREAKAMLEQHGNGPRYYKNTLLFLAADSARLKELEEAVRRYLAWKSIEDEHETLNLDPMQLSQAKKQRENAETTVETRIPETYCWLLVPEQEQPGAPGLTWREIRLQTNSSSATRESLAARAARKLINEELLITTYAGVTLRHELDKIPLWRGDSVSVKQLAEDFAQYLYLPRLRSTSTLLDAIASGVASTTWMQETFAYAEGYDEARKRFLGLKAGEHITPQATGGALLVRPEVALAQRQADEAARSVASPDGSGAFAYPTRSASPGGTIAEAHADGVGGASATLSPLSTPLFPAADTPHALRFYGAAPLDPARLVRDASAIADEVVRHLLTLAGAEVEITLEVHARLPEGVDESTRRAISENCRTLRFTSHGFEAE